MRSYDDLAAELAEEQQAEIGGNLTQPTTPERRSEAVRLAEVAELPVPAVEENLEEVRQTFDNPYDQHAEELRETEVTQRLAANPDLGPAAADSLQEMGIFEKLLIHQGRRFVKGIRTHQLGELGMQGLENDGLTREQTERLEHLEQTTPQDLGLFENENPIVELAGFVSGAVAEQLPIWGLMLFESKEEIAKGASAGAVTGAVLAGTPTAGAAAPVGAAGGAAIGAAGGAKIGFVGQSFVLEGGHAWLEYSRMKDEDGNPMDPDIARGAAAFAGLGAAALETVGFERVIRANPLGERVVKLMTRGGAKKLMKDPLARQAFKKFGERIAEATVVEGITEGAQELIVDLVGVAATEVAEGEFETDSLVEMLSNAWEAVKQGMAGGGGIAIGPAAVGYVTDRRAETRAIRGAEQLKELADTAKNTPLAERLPQVFKAQLAEIREQYGEHTETLLERDQLEQFFQEAGLEPDQVAERMPALAESMAEAAIAGTEVVVPYEELVSELARMDGFENLIPNIRINADGFTARQAEQMATEREAVLAEWQELAAREEAAEAASATPAGRVYEDMYHQMIAAGRSVQEAEAGATLHAEAAVAAAARMKVDAWDWYRGSNLRVGQDLTGEPRGATYDRFDAILDNLRAGAYPSQYGMYGQSLTEWIRAEGGLIDEGGELAARDLAGPGGLIRAGKRAMTLETAHQRAIEAHGDQGAHDREGRTRAGRRLRLRRGRVHARGVLAGRELWRPPGDD